ncbi:MAG: hypothetical protein Q4G03_03110 [Planctomycetia bacterium]|nr:hypothetical protein [Planctomycetia bacterium]
MTQQEKLFYRKIAYVLGMALLLWPLYIIGAPTQRQTDGSFSGGGKLAESRANAGLAEVNLGKIDPTGSAMKLATFGMRGVAISLLWNRSLEYEKRADWDNVIATANQITTLEPHFITIWDFVGWKLAYNASAMFDDYRERYRWVIRGFEFVQEGTTYNNEAPKLYVRTGWTISQKIGIADEKKQYRRLFREDDVLHENQQKQEIFTSMRDNWALGREFYKRAEFLYENHNGDIGKETRLLFYGRAPLNRIRYAEWMSIDGCGVSKDNAPLFDEENCAKAWKLAQDDWEAYASKTVVTTIEDKTRPGEYRKTSLALKSEYDKRIEDLEETLVSYLPEGVTRETIIWDRWNNELDDKQRASMYERILHPFDENDYNLGKVGFPARVVRSYLDGKYGPQEGWEDWKEKLYADRMSYIDESLLQLAQTPEILLSTNEEKDYSTAYERLSDWQARAQALLVPTPEVLAANAREDKKADAQDIVAEIEKLKKESSFSGMFREIMGADYHEHEVAFEQSKEAREARMHRQAVRDLYYAAQPEAANQEFLKCFDSWIALLNNPEFPQLRYLPQIHTDFMDELEKYVIVLEQLETVFPKEYAFQEIVRADDTVQNRLRNTEAALTYIANVQKDGDVARARELAERLLSNWALYSENEGIYALVPIPETFDAYLDSLNIWLHTWDDAQQAEIDLAQQSGVFSSYPGKAFMEFALLKGDEDCLAVDKLEVERLNDPTKQLENLEKEVELWGKVVERAPILKYDTTSEINNRIQNTAQEYILELKKQDKPEPDDFILKDFLNVQNVTL